MEKTTGIAEVKQDARLHEWAEQIKAQQESGMTVKEFCTQNGINIKTYYYHLRKVQECYVESAPEIVPVAVTSSTSDIHIEKNGLQISLPSDISADTLLALVHELC